MLRWLPRQLIILSSVSKLFSSFVDTTFSAGKSKREEYMLSLENKGALHLYPIGCRARANSKKSNQSPRLLKWHWHCWWHWHEMFRPITWCSDAKRYQSGNHFWFSSKNRFKKTGTGDLNSRWQKFFSLMISFNNCTFISKWTPK